MNVPAQGPIRSDGAQSPVVVGVDGGEGSAGALRYAIGEAVRRGAPLRLVHTLPATPVAWPAVPMSVVGTELREVGARILAQAETLSRELAPDLVVSRVLAMGSRSSALVEASGDAQLVVLGRETQHGIDRILVGAVTAAVASRATCAVAVVPSSWTGEDRRGRVVAAIKSRFNAHEILGEAFSQADERGATLTVVTAWELPDPYLDRIEVRTHADDWEADGRRVIEELVSEWRTAYPEVLVDVRVGHGRAADVILAAATESDLLLLSRRHHVGLHHGRLGGVAHAVLRLADVPVVVVPFTGVPSSSGVESLVVEESGAMLR